MYIDAHQHFWRYSIHEYAWISDPMKDLKRNFLPDDLLPLLKEMKFEGTVAVQARQTLGETRWLLELSNIYGFIKGVIGWVDLCSPDIDNQLAEFASYPKFVGIRHVLQDEGDDLFMLQDSFLLGIHKLIKYNLVYDLLILPRHLPYAIQLVQDFPELRFVVNHLAKPFIKEKILSPWNEHIRQLANQPNVYCKLSGMVTEASWNGWRWDDFLPYLDVVFSSFGPERLMIGSDWPVCTLAASYRKTMKIVTDYIARESHSGRELILGKNAATVYNLKDIS